MFQNYLTNELKQKKIELLTLARELFQGEELSEKPLESGLSLNPLTILESAQRPYHLVLENELQWYSIFCTSLQTSVVPPLFIINTLEHLTTVMYVAFKQSQNRLEDESVYYQLEMYLDCTKPKNPVPSLISNYLQHARESYSSSTHYSTVIKIKDTAPNFVKCILFHTVFNLLRLMRTEIPINFFFPTSDINHNELLLLAGIQKEEIIKCLLSS